MKLITMALLLTTAQLTYASGCMDLYADKAEKSRTSKTVMKYIGGAGLVTGGAILAGPLAGVVVMVGGVAVIAPGYVGKESQTKWTKSHDLLDEIISGVETERTLGVLLKINQELSRSEVSEISHQDLQNIIMDGMSSEELCPITNVASNMKVKRKFFTIKQLVKFVVSKA